MELAASLRRFDAQSCGLFLTVVDAVGNDYNVVATNHPPAEREAAQTLDLASR